MRIKIFILTVAISIAFNSGHFLAYGLSADNNSPTKTVINRWDFQPTAVVNGTSSGFAFLGGRDYIAPTFVDIDADGDQDMFFLCGAPNYNVVFMENIGNSRSPLWEFRTDTFLPPPPSYSTYQGGFDFVDIDGDRDFDVFIGSYLGYVHQYRNDGTPEEPVWTSVENSLYGIGYTFTFVDIDNDGDFDMFSGLWNGQIAYTRNDGSKFEPVWNTVTKEYAGIDVVDDAAPVFVDIDADRDYDLFIGNYRFDLGWTGDLYFYENVGSASNPIWEFVTSNYNSIEGLPYSHPAFVDLNGDFDYEMFVGHYSGLNHYENTGTPQIAQWNFDNGLYTTIDVGIESTPEFADIDADGDQDLFIGGYSDRITFYRNDGSDTSPNWVFVTDRYASISSWGSAPTFADIDGDGDLDLFSEGICFYRNDGTPQEPVWTFVTYNYNDINAHYITFFDIDDDNDLDLFASRHNGIVITEVFFYRNDGNAQEPIWTLVTDHYVDGGNGRLTFFDVDQDGDFDVFSGNTYYQNSGTRTKPRYTLMTTNYDGLDRDRHFHGSLCFYDFDGDSKDDMISGDEYGGLYFYKNNLSHFGRIYVDIENLNDPLEDGTKAHPFDRIQEGVNISVSQSIIVAQGTYRENVTLGDGDQILGTKGGFFSPEDPSDDTIIDGGGEFGILAQNLKGALIDGFSLTNAEGGIIVENRSENVTIRNNKFTNNTRFRGAGCDIYGSDNIVLENSIFLDNSDTGYYGTLSIEGSDATVKNCLFKDNRGRMTVYVANGSDAEIINCTFDSNNVSDNLHIPHSRIDISNTIMTNNSGYGFNIWGSASGTVSYSNFWNNANGNKGEELVDMHDNVYADPLYVSGERGDHYLSQIKAGQLQDSPCLNSGSDSALNLGMSFYTTRTDNMRDIGQVDMGFHYPFVLKPISIKYTKY